MNANNDNNKQKKRLTGSRFLLLEASRGQTCKLYALHLKSKKNNNLRTGMESA